jgi:hypothetical protein
LLREALDAQETRDSREISLVTDVTSLETLQEEDVSEQQGTLRQLSTLNFQLSTLRIGKLRVGLRVQKES